MDLAAPAPETSATAARAASPRRHGWLAALLVLLVSPLVAYLYVGRARRGILLAVATTMGGLGLVHATMVIPSPALRITFLALIPATLLFLVADVVALARAETRRGWVPRWYNRWWVYAAWFVAVLLFPFSPLDWVRENVARAYTIPSLSMEPGILQGDYVMAAPLPAGPVARGTVVVYQGADGGDYVARVVGTPGDTLEMRGKTLLVNGRAVREPYVRHTDRQSDPASEEMAWQREFLARPDSAYAPTRDRWGPLVIPAGHHFLLGDNRDNAYDSRYWGLVPRERLVRRPVWIYFSLDRERRVARWSRIGEGIR